MSWSKGSSVTLSSLEQEQFLDALSELLPFDIYVTSGTRTSSGQVRAMYAKLELGGRQELLDTYADDQFASDVADAYPDISAGAAVVDAYNLRVAPSSHLIGTALDLRTRDKTSLQINQMQAAVTGLGGSSLYESVPPHLHVELPEDFSLPASDVEDPPTTKKNIWPFVGLGFLIFLLARRRKTT